MAFNIVRATNQSLSSGNISAISAPFTLAARFYSSDIGNSQGLLVIHDNANPTDRHGIVLRGAAAGDPIDAQSATNDGDTPSGEARSTTGYSQNVWHHAAAVNGATNSRTIYLDAGGSATNTTNVPISGIVEIAIGASFFAGSLGASLDGRVCDAAIWTAALTADEVASLSKGFKPTRIRPQSLVFYAPLIRNLQDTRGGLAITNNNSATVADHPRIY